MKMKMIRNIRLFYMKRKRNNNMKINMKIDINIKINMKKNMNMRINI